MTLTTKDALIKRFEDKSAKIAVLGLGYVGLPLAVIFAEAGFQVTGIDVDAIDLAQLRMYYQG